MSELKNKRLAKSAVAVATAAGLALGGVFGGNGEDSALPQRQDAAILELLNPDTDPGDDGIVDEEEEKRGIRRRRLLALGAALPLSLFSWWGISALSALWASALPALALTALRWVLTALAALAILCIAVKILHPEEGLGQSLRRCYRRTLLLCLLLCCTEGALLWFFPERGSQVGSWLRLLAVTGLLLWMSLRPFRRKAAPKTQSERDYIRELVDSVGRR